jgi:hypothetical protein
LCWFDVVCDLALVGLALLLGLTLSSSGAQSRMTGIASRFFTGRDVLK